MLNYLFLGEAFFSPSLESMYKMPIFEMEMTESITITKNYMKYRWKRFYGSSVPWWRATKENPNQAKIKFLHRVRIRVLIRCRLKTARSKTAVSMAGWRDTD